MLVRFSKSIFPLLAWLGQRRSSFVSNNRIKSSAYPKALVVGKYLSFQLCTRCPPTFSRRWPFFLLSCSHGGRRRSGFGEQPNPVCLSTDPSTLLHPIFPNSESMFRLPPDWGPYTSTLTTVSTYPSYSDSAQVIWKVMLRKLTLDR